MKTRAELLDQLIDDLAAGEPPASRDGTDPELASLVATARQVRRLGLPGAVEHPAVVSVSARRTTRERLLAAGNAIAAVVLLAAIGAALTLVLPGMATSPPATAEPTAPVVVTVWNPGLTPIPVQAAAAPPSEVATPEPTVPPATVPTFPPTIPLPVHVTVVSLPTPTWHAAVQPIGGADLGGMVVLRSLANGDFAADVGVHGIRQALTHPLTLLIAHGRCADPGALPTGTSPDVLLRDTQTRIRPISLTLPGAWLDAPLVLLVEQDADGTRLACADLPVAAATARQPVAGSVPAVGTIEPQPGWHVAGQSRIWPTSSGDRLLAVEASVPAGEERLLWFVSEGDCALQRLPPGERIAVGGAQVRWRGSALMREPGRQALTIVLERQWATRPLVIAAYVDGGGGLVACGDLPTGMSP